MEKQSLRHKLWSLVEKWQSTGLPSRDALVNSALEVIAEKQGDEHASLWSAPPLFATATLDDAWGHGLDIIELYAKAAGMQVTRIGLLMTVEEIISACRRKLPNFLAMTVLQLDSEEDLIQIGNIISPKIKFIAGGPVFKTQPDMARAAKICFVAKDVAAFLEYLLSLEKGPGSPALVAI